MIRFIRAYKWTIGTALVLAAVLAWTLWRGDWRHLIWAVVYGAGVSTQAAAPHLWRLRRRWGKPRADRRSLGPSLPCPPGCQIKAEHRHDPVRYGAA